MVRVRRSKGSAPATERGDVFNWVDHARDWSKILASRSVDPVGEIALGIALWMSGEIGPAKRKIQHAIDMNPAFQVTRAKVREVLEGMGIEFMNGDTSGVRLRKGRKAAASTTTTVAAKAARKNTRHRTRPPFGEK
jgi:hypothetical protein